MVTPYFFVIFLVAMLVGVPVAFGLIFATAAGFALAQQYHFLTIIPQRILAGIDQFPILAVPLFMLTGEIMSQGAITTRLVRLSDTLIGHFRGGLAQVNIASSMLFAGISGSAVADTAALGSIFLPAMEKDGYTSKFAAAVTAASSVVGPIIPPSLIMIIYSYVMETSVAAMFAGGIVPGLLMGLALMMTTAMLAKRRGFPRKNRRASVREVGSAFRAAFLPLLTPLIILGGILGGVFTPTEAGGIAALYALLLAKFGTGTLKYADLPEVFRRTALSSASVLFLVGASTAFAWIMVMSQFPNTLAGWLEAQGAPAWAAIIGIVVILLVVGMFFDAAPTILIMGPILAPIAIQLGMHPVHFAVLMCVVAAVGLLTPPLGLVLFLAASMAKVKVEVLARETAPFVLTHFVVVLLIAFVPDMTLAVPRWLGLL